MRLGFWIVDELTGEDAQGTAFKAKVHSKMNAAIRGTLFLPPYLRPNQCNIGSDSVLFGCIDDVSGKGFAMYGDGDADFQYFFNADIEIQKTLTVKDAVSMEKTLDVTGKATLSDALAVTKDITTSTGNITATAGNFEAMAGDFKVTVPIPLSLSKHVHATAAPGTPSTPIAPPSP